MRPFECACLCRSPLVTQTPWHQNPKVHDRVHMSPPPVPILSQLNPLHTPQPIPLTFILIPSSHLQLGLPTGFFPSGFHIKTRFTKINTQERLWVFDILHLFIVYLTTLSVSYIYIYKVKQSRYTPRRRLGGEEI
jgi:hypothetical protein